jgi:hypothetical protein
MLRRTAIVLIIAATFTATAWAEEVMLTQVSGDVRVSGKTPARAAVAFLKVAEGDKLTLGANASVKMVFLTSGRQEVWKGGGEVTVGAQEGVSPSLKAEASKLPPLILKQLAKTPAVGQQGKTGMVLVRSLDDLEAIDSLEKDYADFRAKAAPDDVTPEVFYLSALLDFQEYDKAKQVLADLKIKQASQPAYRPVVEHLDRLVNAASTPAGARP